MEPNVVSIKPKPSKRGWRKLNFVCKEVYPYLFYARNHRLHRADTLEEVGTIDNGGITTLPSGFWCSATTVEEARTWKTSVSTIKVENHITGGF